MIGHEAAMVWTINGVTDEGAVSFDGVDVFQLDDAGLIRSVRAFWERSSPHGQIQCLRDAEAEERTIGESVTQLAALSRGAARRIHYF